MKYLWIFIWTVKIFVTYLYADRRPATFPANYCNPAKHVEGGGGGWHHLGWSTYNVRPTHSVLQYFKALYTPEYLYSMYIICALCNNCSNFIFLAYRPCFLIILYACKCGRRVAPSPPACPSGHGGDKKLRQWQNNGTKGKNKPRPNIIDKRVFGRIWISPNCITHNQPLLMLWRGHDADVTAKIFWNFH